MRKKFICAFFILLLVLVTIYIYYPRNLVQIIGNEINIDSNSKLTAFHRNSILENVTPVHSSNIDDMKKVLAYFNSYKYSKVVNPDYKKFDNISTYVVFIDINNNTFFKAAARGDKYISIKDKNGRWLCYRVVGDKLNLEFLKNFHNKLIKETKK